MSCTPGAASPSTLCNLAHTLSVLGRAKEGLGPLEEAIEVAQRVGSPRSEALARGNLGILRTDERDFPEARAQLDAAVELAIGVDPRFEGALRASRARWSMLVGENADVDRAKARDLLSRVGDQEELDKLTVTDAMAWGREGSVDDGLTLLDTLSTEGHPVLARRVEEARELLGRLKSGHG